MMRAAVAAFALAAAAPASAASFPSLAGAPPGATSCSGCHGAAGEAAGATAIQGWAAADIVAALAAFRSGARPATVMNRIAPGFDEAESRAIAVWLSQQPAR